MSAHLTYSGTINVAYVFVGGKLVETREPRNPRILRFPAWKDYAEALAAEYRRDATVFLEIVGSRSPLFFGATWSGCVPSKEDLRALWAQKSSVV